MCSDGFSTDALPQKIDGNAFQATFGSGVLKEIRSAATPTGRRSVSTVRCGIEAVVVRPYERRPSPATKRPISTAASASPCASASGLPGLGGDELARLVAAGAQQLGDLADDEPALDGGPRGPRGLRRARPRRPRPRRPRRRPRDAAERLAVGRARLVEPLAARGRPLLAGDEVRHLRGDHQAVQPPSTTRLAPVTYDEASEARKTTAPTASETSISRPSGDRAANASTNGGRLAVLDPVRGQRVDADAALAPVGGEVARQVDEGGLRDRVRDRLHERLPRLAPEVVQALVGGDETVDRADVDDRAAPGAGHGAADHLARERRRRGR